MMGLESVLLLMIPTVHYKVIMYNILIYSGYFILFLNLLLFGFSFFRHRMGNFYFLSYLLFSCIMQFCMELCYHLRVENLFLMNSFFIGQLILLGLFYKSLVKIKGQRNFVNYTIVLVLALIAISYIIDPSLFFKFNLFEIAFSSIVIVLFAFLHLYNMLSEKKEYYFVTIGLISYMLGSTVLYIVGNLAITLSANFRMFSFKLNAFLFILYQFFILFEWFKSFKNNLIVKQ